jgi:hypothetical protein
MSSRLSAHGHVAVVELAQGSGIAGIKVSLLRAHAFGTGRCWQGHHGQK